MTVFRESLVALESLAAAQFAFKPGGTSTLTMMIEALSATAS